MKGHSRLALPQTFVLATALALFSSAAQAELVLSQLVVDLGQSSRQRADIEVWNNSDERAYVAVEPSEIVNAGRADEERRMEPDPEKRGILVSPTRMILEPKQRKLIRVAVIGPRSNGERVYRVTVKPVTGELSATDSGLKLLVGYDVLVLLRPVEIRQDLAAVRSGNRLTFRNQGNSSVELVNGKQCDASRKSCEDLRGKRLYAGAEWTQQTNSNGPVEYTIISNGQSERKVY